MLAIFSVFKEPTRHGRFFSAVKTHLDSRRAIAIVITLSLHLLVLWAAFAGKLLSLDDSTAPRLQYLELAPPEALAARRILEPAVISIKTPTITLLPLPDLALQPEVLTPQELKEFLGDDYYPSQNNTAEIAKNVFHPGLRKQLTEESNKPALAYAEDGGLETYIDASGATIVVSGNGSCLRSPATKIGEPRNWYMVSCAGKTESEKIMDRVDEAVNGKLKLK
ncbi:MAG: hypothetical protein B0W54_21425 [Cellvibrio sp. 79]|nr:MAG: hypothetical protein B0W54_21425 [Cellvibrio sp. 79]